MTENSEFGALTKKEDPYEQYRGKYVVVYTHSGQTSGLVKDVGSGIIVLNPFEITDWSSGVGFKRFDDLEPGVTINTEHLQRIDPYTKKNLESFFEETNKERKKENAKS